MLHIPLERKCVREDPSVGGNVTDRIARRIHNVTAYAWVDTGKLLVSGRLYRLCRIPLPYLRLDFQFSDVTVEDHVHFYNLN